jgi:alanine dehydrogenase
METLILRGIDVSSLITMQDVVGAVEQAYREKGLGRVQMPSKIYLNFPKGDLRVMPSHLSHLDQAGVKVVNYHPGNTEKRMASVAAVIVIIDPETGFPLCIMDGTLITAMRTGGSTAIATKYLKGEDSEVLGIVGSGGQAKTQLEGVLSVCRVSRVTVYDRDAGRSRRFVEWAKTAYPNLTFQLADSVETCVRAANIVCTLTPSTTPIIRNSWISQGVHINAIGADAPGKQELDPEILNRARVVVDDMEQACHSGEINVPLSRGTFSKNRIYGELGSIVAGQMPGRSSSDEVTVFDATGISILDVATGWLTYERARDKHVGTYVNLVD